MRNRWYLAAVLFLAFIAPLIFPANSSATTTAITVQSDTIVASAPLGQSVDVPLEMTNTTGTPVTPLIYEAHSPPATPLHPAATGPAQVRVPNLGPRIDPQIAHEQAAAPDGRTRVLVVLGAQADLSAAYAIRSWAARGEYVYRTLYDHAARTQRALQQLLERRNVPVRSLWIVNALVIDASAADIQLLAGRPEVAMLRAPRTIAVPAVAPAAVGSCSPDDPFNPTCWNIRRIGADRVWRDFGITGQGVVLASIDTGANFRHRALIAQYRGYRGAGTAEHAYSWYDSYFNEPIPDDDDGHGSHTIGTMVGVGDGTVDQPAIGVAPGAQWVAARGCAISACGEDNLIAAAQWVLAPTDLQGLNPRPDLRPAIVNNSWAGPGGDAWFSAYTAAWRAAGIIPVFAGGNTDPQTPQRCGTIRSPGDYADVLAVGATDWNDRATMFTLLGPTHDGRLKPDLAAPGSSIASTIQPDENGTIDRYGTLSGTSMAAPHVAGTAALLIAANPELLGDYQGVYDALTASALPRSDGYGPVGCQALGVPNQVYGYGRLDVYAAVARVRVDIPWLRLGPAPAIPGAQSAALALTLDGGAVPAPGTYAARVQIFERSLTETPTTVTVMFTVTPIPEQVELGGHVYDAGTGQPLHASVVLASGATMATAADGGYQFTLAPGVYTLTASAPGYVSATRTIDLTSSRTIDFALTRVGRSPVVFLPALPQ